MNISPEVMELVALKIGEDWKRLADSLGLKRPRNPFLRKKKKILKCLQERDISWHELKRGLGNVNRGDIIQKICEDFNLDSGKMIMIIIWLRIWNAYIIRKESSSEKSSRL